MDIQKTTCSEKEVSTLYDYGVGCSVGIPYDASYSSL